MVPTEEPTRPLHRKQPHPPPLITLTIYRAQATTTVYLDGVPVPTYSPAPSSCPQGHFVVPISNDPNAANSNACIANPELSHTWECLSSNSSIDIRIVLTGGENAVTLQVSFEDSSKLKPNFNFGPQRPNLTSSYDLAPYIDRDNSELGVALFFWTWFTKVTIRKLLLTRATYRLLT